MNRKNIFIAIGVIGIGVILYKLLLGFVLPIALFLSLGYVLKFLLKGSEPDSGNESSQILTKSEPPSSIDNIVEIQPIEEDKSAEADNPMDKDKSVEADNPMEEDKSAEADNPMDEDKPAGEVNIS